MPPSPLYNHWPRSRLWNKWCSGVGVGAGAAAGTATGTEARSIAGVGQRTSSVGQHFLISLLLPVVFNQSYLYTLVLISSYQGRSLFNANVFKFLIFSFFRFIEFVMFNIVFNYLLLFSSTRLFLYMNFTYRSDRLTEINVTLLEFPLDQPWNSSYSCTLNWFKLALILGAPRLHSWLIDWLIWWNSLSWNGRTSFKEHVLKTCLMEALRLIKFGQNTFGSTF